MTDTAPPTPTWSERRRAFAPWLAVYALTLASRLLLIVFPPSGHLYNSDELEMAQASLDRFLGLPSTTLAWPGSLLLLLDTSLVGLHLAIGCVHASHLTQLSCLSDGLGQRYMAVASGVTELRVIGALLASLAPPAALYLLRRLGLHRRSAIFGAVAIATIPLLWQQGAMATGDAASVGLAMVGIAAAVGGAPLLAGAAAGLALACKVTSLGLAGASLCVLTTAPGRLRRGLRWLLGAGGAFLFACPYAWTDPLRMMKSTLGNFLRPGAGSGLRQVGSLLIEVMGWSALPAGVLAALALVVFLRDPARRGLALSLGAAILVIVLPIARAGNVVPRYALGLSAFLCLLAAIGIDVLWNEHARPKSLPMAMGAAAGMIGLALVTTARSEWRARQPDVVDAAIARLIAEGRGGDLYLPSNATSTELRLWERMSRPLATELGRRAESVESDTSGLIAFMQRRGLSAHASQVVRSAFTEDEAAMRGRLEAVASVAPDGPWRPHLYDPTGSDVASRLAIVEGSRAAAIEAFSQTTGPAALVLDRREDALGTDAEELGGGWYLYRR